MSLVLRRERKRLRASWGLEGLQAWLLAMLEELGVGVARGRNGSGNVKLDLESLRGSFHKKHLLGMA